MAPKWFVAKYIPDMRRREPINVGVVLVHGSGPPLCRFLGRRNDGTIDGRRLRWAGSADNYRAWCNYWVHALGGGISLDDLCGPNQDSNYYLEPAGQRVVGGEHADAESLLEDLYSVLIESTPDRDTLSVARLSEEVMASAGIRERVKTNVRYRVEVDGVDDEVVFDYRYDNGAINLMQRVSLSYADDRAWEAAHAAAWSFQVASRKPAEAEEGDQRQSRLIALVKTRPGDPELSRQVALLEKHASVVNVNEREGAAERLRTLIHLV